MEQHKAWPWKKKAVEKNDGNVTTAAGYNGNMFHKVSEDEVQSLVADKAELEKNLKRLNDRLSSALIKCDAKDELVKKHANVAQEAFAGWEKAEAIALSMKQELDVALQNKVAGEERLMHLEAALKDCIHQLHFVRGEQEKRIRDAVIKTSKEFERTTLILEEELAETNKKMGKLGFENTRLTKALLVKEKLIEDLNEQKTRAEVEYKALTAKISFLEKDNTPLTYEVRLLERELDNRNEEKEFNRRTGDASHKQHLVSAKKIAKLESECQRLRLLIQKRLSGPAALAKLKNEVEMLGRDSTEIRKMKLNSSPVSLRVDFTMNNSLYDSNTKINLLTEQLCIMEEENKILKETIALTALKLSCGESRLEESSKDRPVIDITSNGLQSQEFSNSDFGSDDKVSCTDSWGSALLSDIELFKNGKQKGEMPCKMAGISDITLMGNFAEMEKLAITTDDKPFRSSYVSSDENNSTGGPFETKLSGSFAEVLSKEVVPECDCQSEISVSNRLIQSKDITEGTASIQDIMKVILELSRVTQRKPNEILEDIRVAMGYMSNSNGTDFTDIRERPKRLEKSNPQINWSLSKSISKVIELIEGINLTSQDHDATEAFSGKNPETPTGYVVRVFQWKSSELCSVIKNFLDSCNGLLNGNGHLEKFTSEMTSALEWIMNHCFSLQDVSSMRDEIRKNYGWDDTRSESEAETGAHNNVESPSFTVWNNSLHYFSQTETQSNIREENRRLKDELIVAESAKLNLGKLTNQLQESERIIATLKTDLETSLESKEMIAEQVNTHKLINEDLDTQLTVARIELNEARQKIVSVEIELENRNNSCKELEAMCLQLQLQQESVMKKNSLFDVIKREENQLQTDREISTATEKLAEYQETILNLEKQLKAMASPRDTSLFDRDISSPSYTTTPNKIVNQQRSSLLDRMQADDSTEMNNLKSPKTKEIVCATKFEKAPTITKENCDSGFGSYAVTWSPKKSFLGSNNFKQQGDEAAILPLPGLPAKKPKGGGLWKKLLPRGKKGNSQKEGFHLVV